MKIYDCFTFYNELDLLEMRLEILSDSVDFFVLVEANKTHSGREKELFFHKHELKGVSYEELKEGDRVSFDKTDSAKGPNATNVTRL